MFKQKVFSGCSRPATCISAIISAPSPNLSLSRSATTASIAWSTHAITVWQDPAELPKATREVTAAFIACGIDLKKHIVFNQSQVSGHAELRLDIQLRRTAWAGSTA
jgi:tryptophanyl-tRNA synthetase